MNIRNKLCTYRMEMGTFLEDTRTLQNLLQQTDNDTITFSRKYIWNWNVQKKNTHVPVLFHKWAHYRCFNISSVLLSL